MAAAALNIAFVLEGVGDVIRDIRTTASNFDSLSGSARSANDAVGQLRAQLSTGGSASAFGGLSAQFRSIGLAAESIPDVARDLRERLFKDPLAIGTFGRQVIPSRLGGPQDEGATLREAIKLLRETKNAEERLYKARRLGIEAMLPLADADEKHYQAMVKEGEAKGKLIDQDIRTLRGNKSAQEQQIADIRGERELQKERRAARLGNWWREHVVIPGEKAARDLDSLDSWRRARAKALGKDPGGSGTAQEQATRENTMALRLLRDEYANGGPRAAGAVPRGLRGTALQQALETHGFQMGAFSIGTGGF